MSNFINTEINDSDNATKTNNLLFLISCISLFISLLTYLQVKDIKKEPMTIVQFPVSEVEAEVSWSGASDTYLLMAGQFIASNYYSVTPASIEANFSNILRLAHPSQFTDLQKRLDKERAEFKNLKTVSFLGGADLAEKVIIESGLKNKDYFGVGELGRMRLAVNRTPIVSGSRDNQLSQERKTLNIIFTIESGRFFLVDLYLEEFRKND